MVSRQLGQSYKGLPLCSLFEELCESGSVSIAHLGDFRSHKPARLSVHTNAVARNRRQDGRDDPAGQIHGNVQWATRSLQLLFRHSATDKRKRHAALTDRFAMSA